MEAFIAGTRGIPNRYGGFEQFAEKLSALLVQKELKVSVFNPHTHEFRGEEINGVKIIRVKNYERLLGVFGTLLYDYHCLRQAYRQKDAVVLLCGYGSAFLVRGFFSKHTNRTIIHMDGLEWKRSKWNKLLRWVLKRMERNTARFFPHLVVDHPVLKEYYQREYGVSAHVIAYGAEVSEPGRYDKEHYLVIARLEPENNVGMIIEGYLRAGVSHKLVVVGDLNTRHARQLLKRFGREEKIVFAGGVFERERLRELREKSILYFHGHSVGGTNPSLLEAMADGCLIAFHNNVFNRFVLGENGLFFQSSEQICEIILKKKKILLESKTSLDANIRMIENHYNWEKIAREYKMLFEKITRIE